MCGIVGYVGQKVKKEILLSSLKRLEYRGYDSAGISWIDNGELHVRKSAGKICQLSEQLEGVTVSGQVGLGHTRWATHGKPTDNNAHPHYTDDIAVVHNGIIENCYDMRVELERTGIQFTSETDSEVIARGIQAALDRGESIEDATLRVVQKLQGFFAFVVIVRSAPDLLIAAKKYSPLIVGVGSGEHFVASDFPALIPYTQTFFVIPDASVCFVHPESIKVTNFSGAPVDIAPTKVDWSPLAAEKCGYKHFMLKEIHEQPKSIQETLVEYVNPHTNHLLEDPWVTDLAKIDKVHIVAMGTSFNSGIVGKYIIESLARVSTEVEYAAEFRYRRPILRDDTLVVPISQSGETADTLAALLAASDTNALTLAICNAMQSSIPRSSRYTIYTQAGPEIGVASTKAFTSQLVALYILGLYLGRAKGQVDDDTLKKTIDQLVSLPAHMYTLLEQSQSILKLAKKYSVYQNFLFLGRGINYPIALEGALKLKEISYIHAEGYMSAEMKHGPIALIDDQMPVVMIVPKDRFYDKNISTLEEVKARDGILLVVGTEGDQRIRDLADDVFWIPAIDEFFSPLLTVIPLQLFAYHIAVSRGTDVDQPRNLAKSVTVE